MYCNRFMKFGGPVVMRGAQLNESRGNLGRGYFRRHRSRKSYVPAFFCHCERV